MKKDQFVCFFFFKKNDARESDDPRFWASGNLVNTTFSTRFGREIGDH